MFFFSGERSLRSNSQPLKLSFPSTSAPEVYLISSSKCGLQSLLRGKPSFESFYPGRQRYVLHPFLRSCFVKQGATRARCVGNREVSAYETRWSQAKRLRRDPEYHAQGLCCPRTSQFCESKYNSPTSSNVSCSPMSGPLMLPVKANRMG